MNEELKIAEASWTDRKEDRLDSFSTTAAATISDEILYPLMVAKAILLTAAANDYHMALSRFKQYGGTANREAKEAAKARLYKVHLEVALELIATANGDIEYITRPGYRLDQEGGRYSRAAVPAPLVKKVESKSARGRVKFILKAKIPREIKAIIGRYSLDNGVTWIDGILQFNLNFTLENQRSGTTVVYQFMFRATGNRESIWSESIYVEVF